MGTTFLLDKYITSHPGRVATTDLIASLLATAWPQSVTPVNIMAGYKKCGIYPLNPGEVTDRQIVPASAVKSDSNSVSPASLPESTASHKLNPDHEEAKEAHTCCCP